MKKYGMVQKTFRLAVSSNEACLFSLPFFLAIGDVSNIDLVIS